MGFIGLPQDGQASALLGILFRQSGQDRTFDLTTYQTSTAIPPMPPRVISFRFGSHRCWRSIWPELQRYGFGGKSEAAERCTSENREQPEI